MQRDGLRSNSDIPAWNYTFAWCGKHLQNEGEFTREKRSCVVPAEKMLALCRENKWFSQTQCIAAPGTVVSAGPKVKVRRMVYYRDLPLGFGLRIFPGSHAVGNLPLAIDLK